MIDDDNTLNSRRKFLSCGSIALGTLSASPLQTLFAQTSTADRDIRITGMEVFTVGVTGRTNWIIVRLNTNSGTTGLGEASLGRRTELNELNEFFLFFIGDFPSFYCTAYPVFV